MEHVTPNSVIVDLLKRHVLWEDEEATRVREWPDGMALATRLRHFVAGPETTEWLIGQEDWVADVVIATRDDLIVHGQPERFGFVLPVNGSAIYVNDAEQVAGLARRLPDGLNPMALAELLVQFHPYSSAIRAILTEPDELQQRYQREDLPPNQPFRTDRVHDGMILTFSSSVQYHQPIVGMLLDLVDWTVTIPTGQSASWVSHLRAERIPLGTAGVS